jgi:hypothetical protein
LLELVPNVQFGSSQIGGVQSAGSQIGGVQKVGINNNTINSINGNKKEDIDYQEIVNLYNDTCVSFLKSLHYQKQYQKEMVRNGRIKQEGGRAGISNSQKLLRELAGRQTSRIMAGWQRLSVYKI